jgi:hypothetical protein
MYLLSHQHQSQSQKLHQRRANAPQQFQSRFFKQLKQQMLLQKLHVAQKFRAVTRKLSQKIQHPPPVQQVQQVQQGMRAIQIHATVIAVAAAEDEVVAAHRVKVLKVLMQIHRMIQQKVQWMALQATLQMAARIVAAAVIAPQEKMSLQEKLLMKMA